MPVVHAFSITAADATGTVTVWNGATTASVAASDIVKAGNWNSNHNETRLFGGNTTNASSVTGNDITIAGMGVVSVGGSNGSQVISATAPMMSRWGVNDIGVQTLYSSLGQNTLHFIGMRPPSNVSFTGIEFSISLSSVTSSISHGVSETISYGLYARGTGASTTRYELLSTSSFSLAAGYSSNLSGSFSLGNAGTNFTSSSAGTVLGSVLSGQKALVLPFTGSMSGGGDYLFGLANSTVSVGGTGAVRLSFLARSYMPTASFGLMGNTTLGASAQSVTNNAAIAIYTVTSGGWPANLPRADLSIFSQNVLAMVWNAQS